MLRRDAVGHAWDLTFDRQPSRIPSHVLMESVMAIVACMMCPCPKNKGGVELHRKAIAATLKDQDANRETRGGISDLMRPSSVRDGKAEICLVHERVYFRTRGALHDVMSKHAAQPRHRSTGTVA